jgi:hypothetical protein
MKISGLLGVNEKTFLGNNRMERDVLFRLYASTSGSHWRIKSNWLGGSRACRAWYGIECAHGTVTSIDLGGNGASGWLPTELSALHALRVLNIDESALSGTLPAGIASLTSLETILFATNPKLSGTLPNLSKLTALAELDISRTRISGSLPRVHMDRLRNIRRLQVDHTSLSGTLPPQLGELTSAQALFMHESRGLSGTMPPQMGRLTEMLHGMSLAGTRISGTVPTQIGRLSKLRQLWFVGMALSGSLPSSIGSLAHLNQLEVHRNRLSGSVPTQLGRVPLRLCVLTNAQGPHQPHHGMRPADIAMPDTNRFSCPLLSALPAACAPHLVCSEGSRHHHQLQLEQPPFHDEKRYTPKTSSKTLARPVLNHTVGGVLPRGKRGGRGRRRKRLHEQ